MTQKQILENSSHNEVVNFGCRLNSYESEVIKDHALKAGLKGKIFINTCAVTTEAERQARQTIRKLKRERPDVEIIVTGCSAQINPEMYADMPEVAKVIGNEQKMHLKTYLDIPKSEERILVSDIMKVEETASHLIAGFDGKVRAFVQIQNGCNHRCTFCTIPFGRGNSRSVAIGTIVTQIRELLSNGYKEIVFTGVDITDYGLDLPGKPTLGQMIRRVLALVPDLNRLRLSSLDAVEIDDDLWHIIEHEPRLMPHFHLSLQAGSNLILKRMKRRHLREDAINFCDRIRTIRPNSVFGADIIAGFPTETEEHFIDSLDIVDECNLSFLHVFPYSARPGTPAARMPQVKPKIIKERAKLLREKGITAQEKLLNSMVGKKLNVLIEEIKDGVFYGKSDQFIPVHIKENSEINPGDVITVDISEAAHHHLVGKY